MQPSEEIKAKLDIVDVIRDYIPIAASGVNFKARCPFHREKTPSFHVSPEKQIWHCFGCGRGGDIFSFVQEIEGLSFPEALRLLAPKAGVELRREDPALVSTRNRLLDLIDLSRRFYHKILIDAPQAAAARAYLAKRGLSAETIEGWQIGYAPDSWDTTYKFLRERKFTDEEIFLSGMAIRGQKGPGLYDRFRGRIMFPIADVNGNTVAFTARVSPEKEATEKLGKYVNSPQTVIYDKGRLLFALDKAKRAIKEKGEAILVEGQLDVIQAHQAGYANVIGASGTALTTDQVALLKRFTTTILFAFDMDEAGLTAADRGIKEAMAAEFTIKVITLPSGKDPDDCIRQDPQGWERAVKEARPMMQHAFDRIFDSLDLKQAEDRRSGAKRFLPVIAALGSRIEQDVWLKRLAERIDVSESLLREALPKPGTPRRVPAADTTPAPKPKPAVSLEEKQSELLLAAMLKYPTLLTGVGRDLTIGHLVGELNQSLYRNLIFYYNSIVKNEPSITVETANQFANIRHWLQNESGDELLAQISHLDHLAMLSERELFDLDEGAVRKEAIMLTGALKRHYLIERMKELTRTIAATETAAREGGEGSEPAVALVALMAELKSLSAEWQLLNE